MGSFVNLKIFLVEGGASEIIQCFAVNGNFRINLPYAFDRKRNLLSINTNIEPSWLIIVDTVKNSFELEAGECL